MPSKTQEIERSLNEALDAFANNDALEHVRKRLRVQYISQSEFNARVRQERGLYVVKMYDGLLNMIAATAVLLIDRIELKVPRGTIGPIYTIDESNHLYEEYFKKIVSDQQSTNIIYDILADEKREHAMAIHALACDFVLAHELGHVLNGHLEQMYTGEPRTYEEYLASWESEFQADTTAINLLKYAHRGQDDFVIYIGAVVFFEVCDSLRRWNAKRSGRGLSYLSTHPPSRARRAELFRRTKLLRDTDAKPFTHMRLSQYLRYHHELAYRIPFPDQKQQTACLQELARLGCQFDHLEFFRANPGDSAGNRISFSSIQAEIDKGELFARSLLALTALTHLQIGEFASSHAATLLGLLVLAYEDRYGSDKDWPEFLAFLRECVPTLDHLVDDVGAYIPISQLKRLRHHDTTDS